MLAKFSGLNAKGRYLNLEKENFCGVLTYSIKRASEIRNFNVAGVQQRLRNLQESVMHVKSCSFAYLNLLLFCCRKESLSSHLPLFVNYLRFSQNCHVNYHVNY